MDVQEYWQERGKTYMDKMTADNIQAQIFRKQEYALLEQLKQMQFYKVLDVGCGYGRISKLILDNFKKVEITGIDISKEQLENAKKFVNDKRASFGIGNVYHLDYADNTFDLVVGVDLLLHIPDDMINKVISELIRVSKKYVIHADWYELEWIGKSKGGYCWCHDYINVYRSNNYVVKEVPTYQYSRQSLFILNKETDKLDQHEV